MALSSPLQVATKPLSGSGFCAFALICAALLWAAFATVSLVVDPYDLYGLVYKSGFNSRKTEERRYLAAVDLVLKQPDVLLIGNSRARAFRSLAPMLGSNALVFSAADLRLGELEKIMDFAQERTTLKRLYLGADLLTFNLNPGIDYLSQHRYDELFWFDLLLRTTVSWQALEDSLEVMRTSRLARPLEGMTRRRKELRRVLPTTAFAGILDSYLERSLYRDYKFDQAGFERFRLRLRALHEKGLQIVIFISPTHALLQLAIGELGLLGEWESYTRQMATLADEGLARVVDFSGLSPTTTEAVDNQMWGYTDPSHFTTSVAREVLAALTDQPGALSGFGVALSKETIDDYLKTQRELLAQYRSQHLGLVDLIERLLAQPGVDLLPDPKSLLDAF